MTGSGVSAAAWTATMTEPEVVPAKFYVRLLSEENEDWAYFTVTVCYRGRGRYAVYKGAWESSSISYAANGLGEWDMEGSEERQDEAWLDRHRFSLDDALALAKILVPTVGLYSHYHKRFIRSEDVT